MSQSIGCVFVDEVGDAAQQRVLQTLFHRPLTPAHVDLDLLGRAGLSFELLGEIDENLRGIRTAVEDDVLHLFEHVLRDLFVNFEHAGIHDAHVHARLDGIVEEDTVHGLTHLVVATEAEADVADAATDLGVGEVLLDPACGVDEVERVVVVLLQAGGHGEDVGVENDVLWRELDLIDKDAVGALADADFVLIRCGLALLVKGHDHRGGTVLFDLAGAFLEFVLAFLEGNRVHNALALQAFEAGLDDLPLGGIHHDRHLVHLRLGLEQDEEFGHRGHAIDEAFVHADVDHIGTALHLLTGHRHRLLQLVLLDELGEFGGTGHVRALADHEIRRTLFRCCALEHKRLRAAEAHRMRVCRNLTRWEVFNRFGNGGDMLWRVAAATTHDVHETAAAEILGKLRHVRWEQVKARRCQRVGHASVRVGGDKTISLRGKLLQEGTHLVWPQGAVQTDGQRLHVPHGIEVGLGDLPRDHGLSTRAHRSTDLHGQLHLIFCKDLTDRHEGGLGVEGVKDRLNH